MLQPVHVVALMKICPVMGATAFLSRLRGNQSGFGDLDQVVPLQRLDARGGEYPALVLDLGALDPLANFRDLPHSLRKHFRKAEYSRMGLQILTQSAPHLGHPFAVFLLLQAIETS